MKYAAFVIEQINEVGLEAALRQSMPFDEERALSENLHYLFDSMHTIKQTEVRSGDN